MTNRETLHREYVVNNRSMSDIAREEGVSLGTIRNRLLRFKIPIRGNTKQANLLIDMTDFEVGTLVVVGKSKTTKANQATWTVHCKQCDFDFDVPGWKIRHRQIGGCKNCGKHPNFRGYKELTGEYWARAKKNAKDRNLEFSITMEDAWNVYESQNRRCALTGIKIEILSKKANLPKQTASLDRIDSSLGYVPGNIQWVHKRVNKLKSDFPEAEFIEICRLVTEHKKKSHENSVRLT